MDSALVTVFLPIALGIVMAGLGLELTPQDFSRVRKHPKAVFVALFCQLVLLVDGNQFDLSRRHFTDRGELCHQSLYAR